jgi:subtilisin family serine protease
MLLGVVSKMQAANNKNLCKILALLITATICSLNIQGVNAQSCRKGGIILQHKFRGVVTPELSSLAKVIAVHRLAGRSITGSVEKQARSNKDEPCVNSVKICSKLYRDARKKGYSEYRRAHAFACSADYNVSTLATKKSAWKRPTNDQYIRNQKYAIDSLGLARAWKVNSGSPSIVTVVIDTGADYSHPDLADNLIPGKNFTMGQNTDDASDDNGHGTHVAGTIGAKGNNSVGVAGIAWNSKIMPIKFLDANGSGRLSDAVTAVNYMIYAKQNLGLDIRVSNNSWGGGSYSAAMHEAINAAAAAGIMFVAAAGNEANDNDSYASYPAGYDSPNVVSVGAYDEDLMLSYFSNYGSRSVHIAAPGSRIASTYLGGSYAYLSGTSMAAPHVSGALTLLLGQNPELSIYELKSRLLSTSKYNSDLRGYVKDGNQLNVLNLLRNRTSASLAGLRRAKSKSRAK